MISDDLAGKLHEQLLAERQRLQTEIERLMSSDVLPGTEEDSTSNQDAAGQASELVEREKNLTVEHTLEASLQEVNEALRKFDQGTYGTCEMCGTPISEKRLRALPEATHCIDCQSKLDHQAQTRSAR